MNFELILVIATAVTGVIAYLDKIVWRPQRVKSVTTVKEPIWIEYSRSLFPVFLIVLVLRSFVVEPFRIPSGSMYPTLEIGDFILVEKFAYGVKLPVVSTKIIPTWEPERGDVIVFKYPENPDVDYIKRVIGLPGDTIAYKNRVVYINGKPATQKILGPYVGVDSGRIMNGATVVEEKLPLKSGGYKTHQILIDQDKSSIDLPPVKVPQGHYFMMGDNRDHSYDSRFWGFVPEKNLKGRAFMIWMNWDHGIHWRRIGKRVQ
ncbi:signal peptidase I [Galenea microaerophila]